MTRQIRCNGFPDFKDVTILITHFFLNILQRNSKLAILVNLGRSGHTHT